MGCLGFSGCVLLIILGFMIIYSVLVSHFLVAAFLVFSLVYFLPPCVSVTTMCLFIVIITCFKLFESESASVFVIVVPVLVGNTLKVWLASKVSGSV